MENKFFIGYWLPEYEERQVFLMIAETLEQAKNELAEAKESLNFFGATGITISDSHGIILYRD